MILQRLYKDADAILKQTSKGSGERIPSGFTPQKLHGYVEIDGDDPTAPPSFTPLDLDGKGKGGLEKLLPNVKRTVAVTPLLLSDNAGYALGLNLDGNGKNIDEKFAKFRSLVHDCAAKTENATVQTIAHFLDAWNPAEAEVPAWLLATHRIGFRVVGADDPLTDDAVRRFWAGAEEDGEGEGEKPAERTQCLLSGKFGPVEEMMPIAVKGIPGGQPSGTHLVSANATAFESYGLKRAKTSPISKEAGEAFGNALNALLASERHHQMLASSVYVFWARGGRVGLPIFNTPDQVRLFLDAIRAGKPWTEDQLPNVERFYCFGLTANVARVAVRSAIDTTIGELGDAMLAWFTRLEMVGQDGTIGDPLPIRTLSLAGFREAKDVTPGVEDALLQAALTGSPLPQSLLQLLVNRCRLDTDRRVTYPRAALLKYILTQDLSPEEARQMSQEVTGAPPPGITPNAYHCGRLFSELEAIQRQALPGINATIADKFFGSASSAPASVFGILMAGVQNHLSKLRKEREGAYFGAQKRLEAILAEIAEFPKTLSLKEQAHFSLGYYHHRAAKRADIAERTAAKKLSPQLSLEGIDSEESK